MSKGVDMIDSLEELWSTGRLTVVHPVNHIEPSQDCLAEWIGEAERLYRLQLPNNPPAVNMDLAIWGLNQFYRAAQLMVYRELGEQFIESGLEIEPDFCLQNWSQWSPVERASAHYSVDLFFRFLGDLQRLAKAASPADLLVKQVESWADRWPLSGARIGESVVLEENLEPILLNRCLRILYIERKQDRNISSDEMDHWSLVNAQYEWKTIDTQK